MDLLLRTLRAIKNRGLTYTARKAMGGVTGLADYYLNPFARKRSKLPAGDYGEIRVQMERAGLDVKPFSVDVTEFHKWLDKVAFPREYIDSYGALFVEKALEHYLSAISLDLRADDVMIDVAAAGSPWYEMAARMYGCEAYALDLIFEPGIRGKKIGADAAHMPVEDGFATKLALHCAYEMFEGTSDIALLREAARVMGPGGRMVILPLYMHHLYHYAETAPVTDRHKLDYDGAMRVWSGHLFGSRFVRKYSVQAFMERIVRHLGPLSLRIYYIENETEVDPNCYCKFVALFEKSSPSSVRS